MEQLIFNFFFDDYSIDDLVISECNIECYKTLEDFPKNWGNNLYPFCCIITGASKSGKTFFIEYWKRKNGIDNFSWNNIKDCIAIDNAESMQEEFLLHIFNYCEYYGKYLLLGFNSEKFNFQLPDLKSRIMSSKIITIKDPDLQFTEMMIHRHFSLHQIKVGKEVVQFLSLRLKRTYRFLYDTVQKIINHSVTQKKTITIPLIKEILDEN